MAMARLPGQASPVLMTEQSRPVRSTTADHIKLGEKSPPFPNWTTCASVDCTALTVAAGIAHVCGESPPGIPPSACAAVDAKSTAIPGTSHFSIVASSTYLKCRIELLNLEDSAPQGERVTINPGS